jgi:hypothetical protein
VRKYRALDVNTVKATGSHDTEHTPDEYIRVRRAGRRSGEIPEVRYVPGQ